MSKQLSIGNELKDSYKDTRKWVQNNLKWLRDIEQFYRERAKLEHEYSEKLSGLTKDYFNKKSASSVALSVGDNPAMTPGSAETASVVTWNEVLTQTEDISKEHWRLSRDFEAQVASQLAKIHSKMDTTLSQINNFYSEMVDKRDNAYQEVHKAKKKYDEACTSMESARNKNTKSPGERNRQKMEERKAEMNVAKNEYLIRINQANRIKDKFYFQDTPEVLDLLQDLNECRVLFLNDIWKTAGSVEKATLERISQKLDTANTVVEENKPSLGTAMFIKHNARNWNEPKDFLFQPSPIWQDDENFVISAEPEISDLKIKLAQAEQEYNKFHDMTEAEMSRLSSLNEKRAKVKSKEADLEGGIYYDVVKAYLGTVMPFTGHETLKLRAEVQIESIQNNVPSGLDLNTDDIDLSKLKKKSGLFSKLRNKTHMMGGPSHSPSHLMPIRNRSRKLFGSGGSNPDDDNGSSTSSGHLNPRARTTSIISNSSSARLSRTSSAVSTENDAGSTYTTDTFSTRGSTSSNTNGGNRVVYAFRGRDNDEVSVNPGDSIKVLAPDTGSGWTKLRNNTTGDQGLAPTSYLEINEKPINSHAERGVPPSVPPPRGSKKPSLTLTVQYDYDAQEENEMTVEVGDVVNVLKEDDGSGWTLAELDGDSGLIPTNYCK
ncbi:hypothetical protein ZYGR_0H05290 [Zygosaccharomyces rouxii]|uniref:Protein BZZ1 n=2 Tax=Zygosaccharomyces rouxii TaxID=4956 RepID=C5DSE5_ZYGRC|nr:uncharacterized protein ZYRO0B16214g [Zygosaccharomyces rouxii]KAH9199763.1 hypothetical protein LQ764DRAFT_104869 [Zygosaccharomyces rouxii]GAV47683.1 hypothetical protein ZYGR_0H05290 [Zygosaccharomyces rouxii]CAR26706.1 ZYRO0B16214p [Zygosaccharomyces rouxii]